MTVGDVLSAVGGIVFVLASAAIVGSTLFLLIYDSSPPRKMDWWENWMD